MNAVNEAAAVERLVRYLSVEGVTGREAAIGRAITDDLRRLGVPAEAIRFDTANARMPLPTETGNLIVDLPGARPGPRLMFSAHLDTVPLCAGAKPIRDGNRIRSAEKTALGGDNRTGCAVLVTLIETLIDRSLPHPPLTLLFTVREESGLFGARHLEPADLGGPAMGFNFDGRRASDVIVGAVGAERWEVEIQGKASHAGVHPEQGISASAVAALAIAEVYSDGWFGKVVRREASKRDFIKNSGRRADKKKGATRRTFEGTSNVGSWGGRDGRAAGDATNVVTDFVRIRGESRSHDARFVRQITAAYRTAFRSAAARVRNDRGRKATVTFTARVDYHPFRLTESAAVVRRAAAVIERLGSKPRIAVANGGLDANWLVRHGVPTVTLGAGQNAIHTVDEFVDLREFLAGCRLAVALATADDG